MQKLKPNERLIQMALRVTPDQTVDQLVAHTGIRQKYHVASALRILGAFGLVTATNNTPTTYNVAGNSDAR